MRLVRLVLCSATSYPFLGAHRKVVTAAAPSTLVNKIMKPHRLPMLAAVGAAMALSPITAPAEKSPAATASTTTTTTDDRDEHHDYGWVGLLGLLGLAGLMKKKHDDHHRDHDTRAR